MAGLRTIIILPIVAFVIVLGAPDTRLSCGTLRCPKGTVECVINEEKNIDKNKVTTELCIGSSGEILSKSVKTVQGDISPYTELWWNNTWGNSSGWWNWAVEKSEIAVEKSEISKDKTNPKDANDAHVIPVATISQWRNGTGNLTWVHVHPIGHLPHIKRWWNGTWGNNTTGWNRNIPVVQVPIVSQRWNGTGNRTWTHIHPFQIPHFRLWSNGTWGNGNGTWNWTQWAPEIKKDLQSTLGNIENEINKIKKLLQ